MRAWAAWHTSVDGDRLAHEPGGHFLAAVVEDDAEVDGEVELDDVEDVGLEHRAEAQGRLQVDEPLQQRAAGQSGRQPHLGLDQAKHVGADAKLQCVARAPAERRRGRCRGRRTGLMASRASGSPPRTRWPGRTRPGSRSGTAPSMPCPPLLAASDYKHGTK